MDIVDTAAKSVLIVEDEEALLQALTEVFKTEGFETYTAKDGLEAFNIASTKSPNAILLDILMPKQDGLQMLDKLRKLNEYGKSVPVVALTNLDPDDSVLNFIVHDQPSYYLKKSDTSLSEIVAKVREVTSNNKNG